MGPRVFLSSVFSALGHFARPPRRVPRPHFPSLPPSFSDSVRSQLLVSLVCSGLCVGDCLAFSPPKVVFCLELCLSCRSFLSIQSPWLTGSCPDMKSSLGLTGLALPCEPFVGNPGNQCPWGFSWAAQSRLCPHQGGTSRSPCAGGHVHRRLPVTSVCPHM